ncbi:helix-turn-helix transcriptional regulator [Psychroflexus salinarum]|uniref:Helix-turn-helix transcriptional regulator n=1 Tax=Psychroflexus salinarum TaxID=546024 RepID=A0ABW3GQL7_9FLAO
MANQKSLYRLLKLIALLKKEPPKSINYIADFLESSTRTVYRYLELLEKVGFNIEIDKFKKYSIKDNQFIAPSHFNEEELNFLKELLLSSGRSNNLSTSMIHKLSFKTDAELINHEIYNAKLSNTISLINKAIHTNKQIEIKQYQSINSQKVSDRLVEPFKFTANYRSICAFEIADEQNKFFNIERIGDVVIIDQDQVNKHFQKFSVPDAFGFSKDSKTYKVNLELNLKAMLLLTEEYTLTKSLIQKKDENVFLFSTVIYNPKPLKRFYQGLKNDIKILDNNTIDFN